MNSSWDTCSLGSRTRHHGKDIRSSFSPERREMSMLGISKWRGKLCFFIRRDVGRRVIGVCFVSPHPPCSLGQFHKGKEGGEKSVRISRMKNTSTLTEIDCLLLRNLVMVTIIFLNLSSCYKVILRKRIIRGDFVNEFLRPSSPWERASKQQLPYR